MIYDKKLAKYAIEYIQTLTLCSRLRCSYMDFLDNGYKFLTTMDDIQDNTDYSELREIASEIDEKAEKSYVRLVKYYLRKYDKTAYNSLKKQTEPYFKDTEYIYSFLLTIDPERLHNDCNNIVNPPRESDSITLEELLSKIAKNIVLKELDLLEDE